MRIDDFWSRVRLIIKEKGTTQSMVAKACGLSADRLRTWMSRRMIPPLSYAYRISIYLGVNLEYLINGQGKTEASQIIEEVLTMQKEASEKLNQIRGLKL